MIKASFIVAATSFLVALVYVFGLVGPPASGQAVTSARSAGTVEPGIMVITTEKATSYVVSVITSYRAHKEEGGLLYIYGESERTVIDPARVDYTFYANQIFEIPVECDAERLVCVEIPVTLQDLNLDPLSSGDLPFSTHYAVITSVDPGQAKPAEVTRRWHGQNFTYQALISETAKRLYLAGDLGIGDYVVVSFIEEHPNEQDFMIPIVLDKVVESW